MEHALGIAVFRPAWWPPFFSMTVFRPKLYITVKNGGESLAGWNVSLWITRYDGPLGRLSIDAEGWVEVDRITTLEPWESGDVRKLWMKLESTSLSGPGTYVMRLRFERDDPLPGGLWGGRPIAGFDIAEYFRVEPMSSVLTFGLVAATALTALATLVVALASLVS